MGRSPCEGTDLLQSLFHPQDVRSSHSPFDRSFLFTYQETRLQCASRYVLISFEFSVAPRKRFVVLLLIWPVTKGFACLSLPGVHAPAFCIQS